MFRKKGPKEGGDRESRKRQKKIRAQTLGIAGGLVWELVWELGADQENKDKN